MRGTDRPTVSFGELIRDEDSSWGCRILHLGLYHEQLVRFEEHFDRDQMMVKLYGDFVNDNEKFVRRVCTFIGVDPDRLPTGTQRTNVTRYPKSLRLMQWAYSLWDPVREMLPEAALDRLQGARTAVRDTLFQAGSGQDKPQMDPADRAYLHEYYAEPNRRLEAWLERDLSHWS